MTTPRTPRETPTPRDAPVARTDEPDDGSAAPAPRRAPRGVGCLLALLLLLLAWLVVGWWGELTWWPWFW